MKESSNHISIVLVSSRSGLPDETRIPIGQMTSAYRVNWIGVLILSGYGLPDSTSLVVQSYDHCGSSQIVDGLRELRLAPLFVSLHEDPGTPAVLTVR